MAGSGSACVYCRKLLVEDRGGPHLCASCGAPQPVGSGSKMDAFAVFGVRRAFAQDLGAIEKRFYDLSRSLHPDRFTSSSLPAEARKNSLDRMSLLNQAYRTLRSPDELREHLLALEGVVSSDGQKPAPGEIPSGLAEAWFEIQDCLAENPDAAYHRIVQFDQDLSRSLERVGAEIAALQGAYDKNGDRAELEEIARKMRSQSYLRSLGRDVTRVRERLGKR